MRAVIAERDAAYAELERGGRPGVSVIVPCYNQAGYLSKALASVKSQTVAPLEVIVIDDGSTEDATPSIPDICGLYEARYVRVTNRGLASARNTGLMLARGEWIIPLDSDDWIDEGFIEWTLAEAATSNADVVQVGIQEHGERNGQYWPGFDMPLSQVTDGHLLHTNRLWYCALIRTVLLREVGGWSPAMRYGWEDWDLWRTLFRRGDVRFSEVRRFAFHYLVKPGSMATIAETNRQWLIGEMARHHT